MTDVEWKPTACILCECNCGITVKLGGDDGRRMLKVRGDKRHPASKGYACEKAHRLDYYQNGRDRLTSPLRRRSDGTFEEIGWDVAIAEVAEKLAAIRDTHGGDKIFYFGGGGQGNHLPGAYATATRRLLGIRYKSNALAQEKTGEFWVGDRVLGSVTRADFEHCDVALFIGKNPWQSHSIPRARVTLKQIANDDRRKMIVIDPRVSETAAMADIHLQVRPGCDAWLLTALIAAIVQEDLLDHDFVERCVDGVTEVVELFGSLSVADYAAWAGVDEALVRDAARCIGNARALASFEDLGVQMNRHSTLVSYLHRLVWLLTGNFGKPGTHYIPPTLVPFAWGATGKRSPVVEAPIISGLVPCNVIAEEILTDHSDRYRAMIIEAANPAHSVADSQAMREALESLELVVAIDVAMSESAQLAHYVLPASTQFEKAEATFFNFEFPDNYFQLRPKILEPPKGTLPEAEIHARLCEALGGFEGCQEVLDKLRDAANDGLMSYGAAFMQHVFSHPALQSLVAVVLYRTLGPALPPESREAAVLFGLIFRFSMEQRQALERAGFDQPGPMAALALFEKLIDTPTGVIFARGDWEELRPQTDNGRAQVALPDLLDMVRQLAGGPQTPADFPFVLSAGERRSFTANTIIRNPQWRKKDPEGALRISPSDAEQLGIADGERVRLTTERGSAVVVVEISSMMQPGHVSLPNGLGTGYPSETDDTAGVAPNELTVAHWRDPIAGTPWHKFVPARLQRLS